MINIRVMTLLHAPLLHTIDIGSLGLFGFRQGILGV